MKKYFILVILLLIKNNAFAESLKVIVVDKINPAGNVRVEINDQKLRTDDKGEAVFQLKPGGYQVIGPSVKADVVVFTNQVPISVLQSGDLKLKADKQDLGGFNYEGKSIVITISYETPLNYDIELSYIGAPKDWKIELEKKTVQPDQKVKVNITVPEGSKEGTDILQFIGSYKGQVVCASQAIRLSRDWKEKPRSAEGDEAAQMPISIGIQSSRIYGVETAVDTELDIIYQGNISSRLSGQAQLRYTHVWASQDAVNNLDFRLANVTYLTGIVNLTLGRFDLGSLVQPGEYFGSYLTLGQRRFDGFYAFLPFTLLGTAGVDAQGFRLPPAALSAAYFPNFFSFNPDSKNQDNGYFFSEFKMPLKVFDYPLLISLNYSFTTNWPYFKYSPLSGDPGASLSLEYTYTRNYKVYAEFAAGNLTAIQDTTALMTGTRASGLGGYTLGIIEEACIEYQIPLMKSDVNTFTGANSFHPEEAQYQQGAWYVKLKNKFDFLNIVVAATNSVGDFTFARPAANAFTPYQAFNLNDLRSANEVRDLGKTLLSSAYSHIAFIVSVGATF